MSSSESYASVPYIPAPPRRLEEFHDAVHMFATNNPDGTSNMQDPGHQAFVQNLDRVLANPRQYPNTALLYRNAINVYRERSYANIIQNSARDAGSHFLRQYLPETAPLVELDDPAAWTEFSDQFEEDPMLQGYFAIHLEMGVQTTVPGRGAPKVAALRLLDRTDELHFLEGGPGRGHVLGGIALDAKVWQYGEEDSPIEVVERRPDGSFWVNETASEQFTALVNQKVKVGRSVAIDIEDEIGADNRRNQELKTWGSHSFYLINEYVHKFKRFIDYGILEDEISRLTQIGFLQADIADRDHNAFDESFEAAYPDFEADVVILCTVMNQLQEARSKRAISNLGRHAAADHVRIEQDFMHRTPDGRLYLPKKWPPNTYRTYVEDHTQPNHRPRLFFVSETSRCERIRLTPYAARLALNHGIDLKYPGPFKD